MRLRTSANRRNGRVCFLRRATKRKEFTGSTYNVFRPTRVFAEDAVHEQGRIQGQERQKTLGRLTLWPHHAAHVCQRGGQVTHPVQRVEREHKLEMAVPGHELLCRVSERRAKPMRIFDSLLSGTAVFPLSDELKVRYNEPGC